MSKNQLKPETPRISKRSSESFKVIGNYKIEKSIGEGTFAKVRIGKHIPTGEKVAIKILEKEKIKDKKTLNRITRELSFLKMCNHPNIIKLYEILETTQYIFIVMEYPSQGELFEYIVKKKRLSELEASVFFVQIINGIEYLHNKRIAHRDLKPENLIIDKNHLLKIIDFGLSNNYTDYLQTPCGSPCYAAPEMIQGKKYTGVKIDIWSTGIILFAMVCGYLPFEDEDNSVLYKKILECKLEFPFKMNNSCVDMIRRILTTSPDKRINMEEIKRHPFYLLGDKIIKRERVYTTNSDKVEETVLERMEKMGFISSEVKRDLNNSEYSNTTATYYLIYKRLSREIESNSKNDEIVYIKTEPSSSCNRLQEEERMKNNKCGNVKINNIITIDSRFPQSNLMKENLKKDLEDQNNKEKKHLNTDVKTPSSRFKIKMIDINMKTSKNSANNKFLFTHFEKTRNVKIKDKYINLCDLKMKEIDFNTRESLFGNIFGKQIKPSINFFRKDKLTNDKKAFNKTDTSNGIGDSTNFLNSFEKNVAGSSKNDSLEKKVFIIKMNNRVDSFSFTPRNIFEKSKRNYIFNNSIEKYSSYNGYKELSDKINKQEKGKMIKIEKNFDVSSKLFFKKNI